MLYIAFIFQMMLLLLAIFSFLFADLEGETYAILIVNFVLLGIAISLTALLIFLCGRHQRRELPF